MPTIDPETNGDCTPDELKRPLFYIRPGIEFILRNHHYIILDDASDEGLRGIHQIELLQQNDLTRFRLKRLGNLVCSIVPDDFVPLGRRLNSAGDDNFEAELRDSIDGIGSYLRTVAAKTKTFPSGGLSIADVGFLRADGGAEVIPPLQFAAFDSGENLIDSVVGIQEGLLDEIATDTHASHLQRTTAQKILREKMG